MRRAPGSPWASRMRPEPHVSADCWAGMSRAMFAEYVAVSDTNVHPSLAASPAAWLQLAVKDLPS